MIEVTEFQIALFASSFDLSDETVLTKQIKDVFGFDNPTQNILPQQAGSLLPRIYVSQDSLEVQAGESKINLIFKQNEQQSLALDDFLKHVKKFTEIDYFKNIRFTRIGFAVTEVKHVDSYSDFIKKVFVRGWSQEAETFSSRTDYFFNTDTKQEAYLVVLMQSVLNSQSEKGALVQFDVSTKETEDINKKSNEIIGVVEDLVKSDFFEQKKKHFET